MACNAAGRYLSLKILLQHSIIVNVAMKDCPHHFIRFYSSEIPKGIYPKEMSTKWWGWDLQERKTNLTKASNVQGLKHCSYLCYWMNY